MLKQLRENMKTILWITIISFIGLIFLAWGMDIQSGRGPSPGTMAKVNGYTVTRAELEQATRNTFEAYRQQFGKMPADAEAEGLRDQAWASLVQQILLTQEAGKRRLGATDEEVLYSIRMDPPEFVRSVEMFQKDGVFDPEKYRQSLNDPLMDWTTLEYWVRSTLPVSKLQDLVTWGAKVSEPEVREAYDLMSEKRTISYIFVDPLSFTANEDQITDGQVREYYSSNKEQFIELEQAKLAYVFLEVTPSPGDSNEVLGDLARILDDIKGGEDFAEMARIHSEDPAAEQGGGDPAVFFRRGDLRGELADVLFSMEKGEVSEPFVDANGYHVVKLEDKTTVDDEEQVSFRHILKTVSASQITVNSIWEKTQRIQTTVAEHLSLEEAVEAEGLQVTETPYFKRQGFVPGLTGLPKAQETAFSMETGEVRGPLTTYRGHYFIELRDKNAERLKPFDEVAEQCRDLVIDELLAGMAHDRATALSQAFVSAGSLEQVALAESLEVMTAGPFNRSGFIPGVGRDNTLIGATFALSPKDPLTVVKGIRGSYVIRVDSVEKPDREAFEREKQALAQRMLQQKRARAYTAWMTELEESADIKDFRDSY